VSDGSATHPDPEQLRNFRLGLLPAADSVTIRAHLDGCADCQSRSDLLAGATQPVALEGATSAEPVRQTRPATAASTGEMPKIPPELADHARYRILQLLGAGGMGRVYLAEHRVMERLVALKVIKRSLTDEPAAVERFHREVKAAARLTHPNIVAAHDAERAGDLHFLVMEYVEGADLAAWVAQHGPLPPTEACEYIRQAAHGLAHAHERGMIHRDVKPANLMRTSDGRIKILDFGLARFGRDAAAGLTNTGAVMGTPDYIAPEQAMDSRAVDHRVDIYSLGCTLYFLLTGRPPYDGGSAMEKLFAHIEGAYKPLAAVRPDLPIGLSDVVGHMMALAPEGRYATAIETAEALAAFCAVADAVPVVADATESEVPWVAVAEDPSASEVRNRLPESLPVGLPVGNSPIELRTPLPPMTKFALTLGLLILPCSWLNCSGCLTLPVGLVGACLGVIGWVGSRDGPRRNRSFAVLGVGMNAAALVLAVLGNRLLSMHTGHDPARRDSGAEIRSSSPPRPSSTAKSRSPSSASSRKDKR
jgi:serine/threonine protein kinase